MCHDVVLCCLRGAKLYFQDIYGTICHFRNYNLTHKTLITEYCSTHRDIKSIAQSQYINPKISHHWYLFNFNWITYTISFSVLFWPEELTTRNVVWALFRSQKNCSQCTNFCHNIFLCKSKLDWSFFIYLKVFSKVCLFYLCNSRHKINVTYW